MSTTPGPEAEREVAEPADTRRTLIALLAAWAVPGLGHLLLGRWRRGVMFGLLIWICFAMGLAHSGRLALRDPQQPFLTALQVVANVGIGPADLVARRIVYDQFVYSMPLIDSGRPSPRKIFRERARSPLAIYGTAYIWTAGLMNLLLLFDIWDIGRGRKD